MLTAILLLNPFPCCALALSGGRLPRCVSAASSSPSQGRQAPAPMAQLVRVPPRDENDGDRAGGGGGGGGDDDDVASDGDGDGDGTILAVSRVADAEGRPLEATGRSVASVQFMITRAMRAQLTSLGYTPEEVDRMDPPRAAAILARGVPSSKQAQSKPKRKRERFELQFTCNVCEAPNSHSISHHAYARGTVLVTCPGCQSAHLIADHLNWIEEDFSNLEEFMERRGTPVTTPRAPNPNPDPNPNPNSNPNPNPNPDQVTKLIADGVAESAAAQSAAAATPEGEAMGEVMGEEAAVGEEVEGEGPRDPRRPWAGTKPGLKPLAGITDERARRLRVPARGLALGPWIPPPPPPPPPRASGCKADRYSGPVHGRPRSGVG